MSFKDQPWAGRTALGDESEGVFEDNYPMAWTRFGLNRPLVPMSSLPPFLRHTPDYVTSRGLVECQGFGRDQLAKFKRSKIDALLIWHHQMRVDFFLWDSANKQFGWVRLPDLVNNLHRHNVKSFHEGNQYFEVAAGELPMASDWTQLGQKMAKGR